MIRFLLPLKEFSAVLALVGKLKHQWQLEILRILETSCPHESLENLNIYGLLENDSKKYNTIITFHCLLLIIHINQQNVKVLLRNIFLP